MPEFTGRKIEPPIYPGLLRVREEPQVHSESLEIVVPYTSDEMTARVMQAAASMTHGLNATLKLVAVYIAPYPAELRCPAAFQEHFAARLTGLAQQARLPFSVQLVVARDRNAGFRHALRPHSAILLGSAKRIWRTPEEKLARSLKCEGHLVSLLHFS